MSVYDILEYYIRWEGSYRTRNRDCFTKTWVFKFLYLTYHGMIISQHTIAANLYCSGSCSRPEPLICSQSWQAVAQWQVAVLSLAGLSLLFWVGIWTGSAMMTWLSVMDISMGPWSSWVLPDLKFEFLLQSSSTVYDMFEINEGITRSFPGPWRTVCPRERILGRNWILSH